MNDSEETKTTREALVHDVHLRLTEDDMHLVRGVAEVLSVTQSKAIRLMLRRSDGGAAAVAAAPVLDDVRDALERFARAHELHAVALDRVGANLNQIARHLNSGERAHDHEVIVVLDQTQRVLRVARSYLGRDPEKMLRWLGLHELMIESEAA